MTATRSVLVGLFVWLMAAAANAQLETKLIDPDGGGLDKFGAAAGVSGDLLIVGAPESDDPGLGADVGSALIYRNSGGGWILEQALTASDGAAGDQFGEGVAISGDLAVVGASQEQGGGIGAAYIYRFDGTKWDEEQKLTASVVGAFSHFGSAVSIDGDAVVIASPGEDIVSLDSGAAYVFRRDTPDTSFPGTWSQEAKLTASDAAHLDQFADSVDISGDAVIVGVPLDDDPVLGGTAGSAYVYRFDGVNWAEEQKLTAPLPAPGERFGNSVKIDGDVALIGAPREFGMGSAYVFSKNGTWSLEQQLFGSDALIFDQFGFSVAIDGGMALIGAKLHDLGGGFTSNEGGAWLFRFDGFSWSEDVKLSASDAAPGDEFGFSVALDGGLALAGAVMADGAAPFAGALYVFSVQDEQPEQDEQATTLGLIDDIGALVGDGTLAGKDGNKLIKKLDKAQKNSDEGKLGKSLKDLQKFVTETSKLADKGKLSQSEGQFFMNAANGMIDSILDGQATQDLIGDIGALVDDGTLAGKDGKKLTNKLHKVLDNLLKGKPDKSLKAVKKFTRDVSKLIHKEKLIQSEGQSLIDAANGIITPL
jgi:hypothetical protein